MQTKLYNFLNDAKRTIQQTKDTETLIDSFLITQSEFKKNVNLTMASLSLDFADDNLHALCTELQGFCSKYVEYDPTDVKLIISAYKKDKCFRALCVDFLSFAKKKFLAIEPKMSWLAETDFLAVVLVATLLLYYKDDFDV